MAVISGRTNYVTTGTRDDVLLELALEGGDEVGDGVSLGVGFVALWLRRSEMKNLFVVLDEEMRLEVELLQQELRGHAVGDDDVGDELLQHVAALEGLAEELFGADGGEEVQSGDGDLLELERGAGGADGGEERPDGGGEGLEILDEEVGVVVDTARGDVGPTEIHGAEADDGGLQLLEDRRRGVLYWRGRDGEVLRKIGFSYCRRLLKKDIQMSRST